MKKRKKWSLSTLDFEILLLMNSDLSFSVPAREMSGDPGNEVLLNGINRLVTAGILALDDEEKEVVTRPTVRTILECIAHAERMVKIISGFHNGSCTFVYFAPEGCAAFEISAIKSDIVKLYMMKKSDFANICGQAVEDALEIPGEDARSAFLGLDEVTREAIQKVNFSTSDEDVVMTGCSLALSEYSLADGELMQRYVFYATVRSDLYLFCDPENRIMETGCSQKVQQLTKMFFGGQA